MIKMSDIVKSVFLYNSMEIVSYQSKYLIRAFDQLLVSWEQMVRISFPMSF